MLESRIGDDKSAVILMVFNKGYSWMFYNFICSLDNLSTADMLDVKKRLLIVVTNKEDHDILSSLGFLTYFPDWLPSFIDERAMNFGDGGFEQTVTLQMMITVDLLTLGYSILLQDVDIAWNKNPIPYLLHRSNAMNLDIQMAFSGRKDEHGPGNSGFLFIRSNCKTQVLIHTMSQLVVATLSGGKDDQTLWNALIHDKRFRQIHFEILDTKYFINGHQLNLDPKCNRFDLDQIDPKREHFVFHASWTWDQFDKIEKYYNMEHFYFNKDQCPLFYDPDLIPPLSARRPNSYYPEGELQKKQEQKFLKLELFRRE